jgi:hypothetical protein
MMETAFSVGSVPRLYKEDPRRAEVIFEGVSSDGLRRDGNQFSSDLKVSL